MCRSRDKGGLRIQIFKTKNDALLSKWLFKLLRIDMVSRWLIQNKYMGTKSLVQVEWKQGTRTLGQSYEGKHVLFHFGIFIIKDGSQIKF